MSSYRFIPFTNMNSIPLESFYEKHHQGQCEGIKRKLNGDLEGKNNQIQQKRKRGRPSFWNNLEEKNNNNEDEKLLLTPQIIVKRQRRLKANDRERNRMKNLNKMLQLLKSLLPFELNNESSMDDKLTKIETLKMATLYIAQLTQLLQLSEQQETSLGMSSPSSSSSSSLSSIQMNNNEIKSEKIDPYYYYHHHHPQQSNSPTAATSTTSSMMCQYAIV